MPRGDRTSRPFDPGPVRAGHGFAIIGSGSIGAKAGGLAAVKAQLETAVAPGFAPAVRLHVPALAVIATDVFDRVVLDSRLADAAVPGRPDVEITAAFERAPLPADLRAALGGFLARVRVPVAVRSSSRLEDAMHEPFAGVYVTEMLANRGTDENRLAALERAIRRVFASTFLERARNYRRATGHSDAEERMAVIVQHAVGTPLGARFYPHVSGVARSCNFYPAGLSTPEDGVVDLALGLGRTIVEEGVAWSFSPAAPHANPPYNEPRDLLERTQKTFWAIDLAGGRVPPGAGTVSRYDILDAERDGALRLVASTYLADDDRIVAGTTRPGPRVVDFGPILKAGAIPLAAVVRAVLDACAAAMGTGVEIEFAATWENSAGVPAQFALLQVRPMFAAYPEVDVDTGELERLDLVAASTCALGNGAIRSIRDIVYLKPERFDPKQAPSIVQTIEVIDRSLVDAGRPYLLIGFGRWGSTDPSAGIPVDFGQISGAKVIVETTLPSLNIMLSQGSHFFHNITSARVLYFSLSHLERNAVDWGWLAARESVVDTEFVRHVRLAAPLDVRVDGRTRRGVIAKT